MINEFYDYCAVYHRAWTDAVRQSTGKVAEMMNWYWNSWWRGCSALRCPGIWNKAQQLSDFCGGIPWSSSACCWMPRKWALIRPRITGLNSKMAEKPSWSRENFDGALSENTYPLLLKHLMLWCTRLLQQMAIMYSNIVTTNMKHLALQMIEICF